MAASATVPYREGISDSQRIADGMKMHQLRLSQAASLQALSAEYAFFNHGAFLCWSGMVTDPLADIVQKRDDPDLLPAIIRFDQPVLSGITGSSESHEWEYQLVAVPLAKWSLLLAELKGVAALDRAQKRFSRVTHQDIDIVDPLLLGKTTVIPTPLPEVTVSLFGIDGTHQHRIFASYPGTMHVPRLISLPLRRTTQTFANALLAENPQPYRSIEEDPPWMMR